MWLGYWHNRCCWRIISHKAMNKVTLSCWSIHLYSSFPSTSSNCPIAQLFLTSSQATNYRIIYYTISIPANHHLPPYRSFYYLPAQLPPTTHIYLFTNLYPPPLSLSSIVNCHYYQYRGCYCCPRSRKFIRTHCQVQPRLSQLLHFPLSSLQSWNIYCQISK